MNIKRLYTFGITSALALASVAINGCAADGTESGEQIGASSEALITPSPAVSAEFPGVFKIDANHMLQLGGYDPSTGNAVNKSGIYTKNGATETYLPLVDATTPANASPLPVSLGEVQIVKLADSPLTLLVAGGRQSVDAAGEVFTRIVKIDPNASGNLERVTWFTPSALATGRVAGKLLPCGNKVAYFGGAADKGMEDVSNAMSGLDSIEVFSFNSGNPAASTWASMKDSGGSQEITLNTLRSYPFAFAPSSTQIAIAGGVNENGLQSSVDLFSVDSACKLTTAPGNHKAPLGHAMPAARAQGASITASITVSSVTYDGLALGGISGLSPQSVDASAYAYDFGSDAWTTLTSMSTARAFSDAISDGTDVLVVGGAVNSGATILSSSSSKIQKLVLSSATWNTETNLGAARAGAAVAYLDGAVHACFGASLPSGAVQTCE